MHKHSYVSIHKYTEYSPFICTFLGDQPSKLFLTGKEEVGLGAWFINKIFHKTLFILHNLVVVLGLISAFRKIKTVEQTRVDCTPSQWNAVRPSSDSFAEPELLYFSTT